MCSQVKTPNRKSENDVFDKITRTKFGGKMEK